MMTFNDDFQGKYSSVGCVVFQPDPHHCLFHHLHPAHPDCHHCHHDHHCHEWERTFLARAFTSLPVEAIDLLVAVWTLAHRQGGPQTIPEAPAYIQSDEVCPLLSKCQYFDPIIDCVYLQTASCYAFPEALLRAKELNHI